MKVFLRLYYELKRFITKKPFIAEIDITNHCNLRCKHCYHFAGEKKFLKEEPDIKEWEERFRHLKKIGVRMIMLMGGEPMLRSDIVLLANKIFPFVEMITNGTISLPDKRIYRHKIFVSIDGSSKTNDSIRGEGVFNKVVENVKNDNRVIFNMTLLESNYKELESVVKLAKQTGVSGVVCNIFTTSKEVGGHLDDDVRKKIVDELISVKKKYPFTLLATYQSIKWYEIADHTDSCYWREQVLHYDINLKSRYCFADADCSNCGCFAGATGSPMGSFRQFYELFVIFLYKVFFK